MWRLWWKCGIVRWNNQTCNHGDLCSPLIKEAWKLLALLGYFVCCNSNRMTKGRNQICSGDDIWVCNWTETHFKISFGLIGKSSYWSIDQSNIVLIQLPCRIVTSWIDTFMEVVKPVVTENFDCPLRGLSYYQNFWYLPAYHTFDAKIGRNDFLIESSKINMQLSFEDFMRGIKSLATVKVNLRFQINI